MQNIPCNDEIGKNLKCGNPRVSCENDYAYEINWQNEITISTLK